MTGQKGNGPDLSFAGLLLLAALGTVLWKSSPLESSRPHSSGETKDKQSIDNQMPTKLWQGPFESVLLDPRIKKFKELNYISWNIIPCRVKNMEPKWLRDTQNPKVRVLAPMLTIGDGAESLERRRRHRYAVVSGLGEADFVPDTPNAIGFCTLKKTLEGHENFIVPYEWYRGVPPKNSAVLLLWLNETVFMEDPMGRFRDMASQLAGEKSSDPLVSIFVLGPAQSGTLSKLADRALKENIENENIEKKFENINIEGLHILSPVATTAWPLLLQNTTSNKSTASYKRLLENLESMLNELSPENCKYDSTQDSKFKPCVSFLRTIQTDDVLVNLLVDEIRNNRPWSHKEDHIALISEWDTLFGRSLPKAFKLRFCDEEDPSACKKKVRLYSYLRGIDGHVSNKKKPQGGTNNGNTSQQSKKQIENENGTHIRRPVGTGQFDYLRRLANKILETDKELRTSRKGRIRAIGILGSDVYDKLLILRALRPQFPNTLFFTTDLDAQLLQHSDFRWSRNLIIASSFGLELQPDLQGDIPPFRSNYQTSIFFSTLLAAKHDFHDCWSRNSSKTSNSAINCEKHDELMKQIPGLLFEVGRHGAIPLNQLKANNSSYSNTVHPTPLHSSTSAYFTLTKLIFIFILFIVAVHQLKPASGWPVIGFSGVLISTIILAIVAIRASTEGEPLSLTQGVSVWPTEFIRFAAFFLAAYFIRKTLIDLYANCARLNRDFFDKTSDNARLPDRAKSLSDIWEALNNWGLSSYKPFIWTLTFIPIFSIVALGMYLTQKWYITRPLIVIPAYWAIVLAAWYVLVRYVFKVKSFNDWVKQKLHQPDKNTIAWDHWDTYCSLGRPKQRYYRSISLLLLYMFFASVVFSITGFPESPTRGTISFFADKVMVVLSVSSMLMLIFIVLDEFRMCIYWIRGLTKNQLDWTKATIRKRNGGVSVFKTQSELEWVKIKLIAERTAEIGRLIYYPFLIIIIMLLSRHSYFDNWGMPTGLAIVVSIPILLLISAALKLRHEAENCRKDAISYLKLELLSSSDDQTNRLEKLINDTLSINEGAFQPIREQPLVRASLPLLGAIGLTLGEISLFN